MQNIDLLNKYNDLFIPSFICLPYKTINGDFVIDLTEKDKDTKLRRLQVKNIPQNTILLVLNEYSKIAPNNKIASILQEIPGVIKCCDYLLITIIDNKIYYFFIEMKSKNINPIEIKQQFKGASSLVEYFNAIIEYFYDLPYPKLSYLNPRYVLFSGRKLNKTKTKFRSYEKHSLPEHYIQHNVGTNQSYEATVEFSSLLGKTI
jgi:hypothetical protein